MKTTKEVTVLCRYALKTNGKLNGTVVYCVRSSNGKDFYYTTLVEGKASSCSCPAKGGCYHKKGLESKEAARPFAAKSLPAWAVKLVSTSKLEVPGKPKVVVLLAEKVRKPRKFATEMMEKQAHYASVKSQMAEIRERREAAPLNGSSQGFQILR